MTNGWDGDKTMEKRAVNQSTAVEDKVKVYDSVPFSCCGVPLSKLLSSVHVSLDCSDKATYCYYSGTTMQE